MPSLLVELETNPTTFRPGEAGWDKDGKDTKYAEYTTLWEGKVTVDLAWVAAAMPIRMASGDATQILMCGSSQWQMLNIPYRDFMASWQWAKGL